mmetsp:Transcript_6178/g.11049  ORF Transcript_6178/g.11049 Transcript_6178/m.11049 type:complete len:188 (+) Transcript_6178:161-724(+)
MKPLDGTKIMVDDTPLINNELGNTRRGMGICCDSKRGLIITNTISLVLTTISMIGFAVAYSHPNWEEEVMDQEVIDRINGSYVPSMIINGIALAVNLLVIVGAHTYNIYPAVLGIVYIFVHVIYTLAIEAPLARDTDRKDLQVLYITWPIVWGAIMLFWHILFVWEVKRGVMSRETYDREKYSCCCV